MSWLQSFLYAAAAATALSLLVVVTWTIREQRRIKRARLDDPNEVRPSDVAHAIRGLARLERSHEATTSTVTLIEGQAEDLRRILIQAIDELAVRPAPDPIVRSLYDDDLQTLEQLTDRLGPDVVHRVEDLIDTHQITRVNTDDGVRYQFVPHDHRPDDVGYAGRRTFWSLSRLIAMSTEIRSATSSLNSRTIPLLPEAEDTEHTEFRRAVTKAVTQGKKQRRRAALANQERAALPKGATPTSTTLAERI